MVATTETSRTAGGHVHALALADVQAHAHVLASFITCSSTHALALPWNVGIDNTIVPAKRIDAPREYERRRAMICVARRNSNKHIAT